MVDGSTRQLNVERLAFPKSFRRQLLRDLAIRQVVERLAFPKSFRRQVVPHCSSQNFG